MFYVIFIHSCCSELYLNFDVCFFSPFLFAWDILVLCMFCMSPMLYLQYILTFFVFVELFFVLFVFFRIILSLAHASRLHLHPDNTVLFFFSRMVWNFL